MIAISLPFHYTTSRYSLMFILDILSCWDGEIYAPHLSSLSSPVLPVLISRAENNRYVVDTIVLLYYFIDDIDGWANKTMRLRYTVQYQNRAGTDDKSWVRRTGKYRCICIIMRRIYFRARFTNMDMIVNYFHRCNIVPKLPLDLLTFLGQAAYENAECQRLL